MFWRPHARRRRCERGRAIAIACSCAARKASPSPVGAPPAWCCGVVGIGASPFVMQVAPAKSEPREIAIARATAMFSMPRCGIAQLPKSMLFTFVDLGPRVITVTHHNAVIGPYHRNGEQIADVMNTFRGDAEQARRLIAKYRSDYLLICPNSSTTTLFMSAAPKGFYAQLKSGKASAWLTPIPLPADSPFKLWKVAR